MKQHHRDVHEFPCHECDRSFGSEKSRQQHIHHKHQVELEVELEVEVGDHISYQHENGCWYPAQIMYLNGDGTFDVQDQEDFETHEYLPRYRIKIL